MSLCRRETHSAMVEGGRGYASIGGGGASSNIISSSSIIAPLQYFNPPPPPPPTRQPRFKRNNAIKADMSYIFQNYESIRELLDICS